jgi:hypothetical protein
MRCAPRTRAGDLWSGHLRSVCEDPWGTAVLLAEIALTGCSSSPAVKPQPTPSPTPTVEEATENEVATVIAEYASDWQETIDEAYASRLTFVIGGDVVRQYVCETRERTIGLTASLASRDLRDLNVPASMKALVDDTDDVPSETNLIDVTSLCGDHGWTGDNPDCNSVLASRYSLYTQLHPKLDAWSPYL